MRVCGSTQHSVTQHSMTHIQSGSTHGCRVMMLSTHTIITITSRPPTASRREQTQLINNHKATSIKSQSPPPEAPTPSPLQPPPASHLWVNVSNIQVCGVGVAVVDAAVAVAPPTPTTTVTTMTATMTTAATITVATVAMTTPLKILCGATDKQHRQGVRTSEMIVCGERRGTST